MYITAKPALKICLIWKTASVQMYLKGVSKGLWGCVVRFSSWVFPSQPPPPLPPSPLQHYHKHIHKILAIPKIPPPKNKVCCAFQFAILIFRSSPAFFSGRAALVRQPPIKKATIACQRRATTRLFMSLLVREGPKADE